MNELGPDTVVRQSGDVISREISGQLVILTPAAGTIHELDDLGSFIWSLCAEPSSLEKITARIVDEYDVESAVAADDLAAFLAQLIDAGAVIKQ